MLMLYPLLCSMNKKLCSELALVGSFASVIRKDLGFGRGLLSVLLQGCSDQTAPAPPAELFMNVPQRPGPVKNN